MTTFDQSIVLRLARPSDIPALSRLPSLAGANVFQCDVLVAEVDGEVLAAVSLVTGEAVAEPVRAPAHLLVILELRAEAIRESESSGSRWLARLTGRSGRVIRAA